MMIATRYSFNKQFSSKVDKETKQILQNILSHQPIDMKKLKSFVQLNYVPSDYHILVWKLLLGITPRFTESQEFVQKQHNLIYDDLFTALKVLGLGVPISYHNNVVNGSLDSSIPMKLNRNASNNNTDTKNPMPEHFFLMWLISEARLSHNPEHQLNAVENRKYIMIGHKLSSCNLNNGDLFHICSFLWSFLRKSESKIHQVVENAFGLLRKKNECLHKHLWTMELFSSSLVNDQCSSLFCEILTDSAFENIFGKVLAGNLEILSYVVVAILCQLQIELLSANSVESVRNVLYEIRREQADAALIMAIDEWHKLQRQSSS